jgi:hypothetical protein
MRLAQKKWLDKVHTHQRPRSPCPGPGPDAVGHALALDIEAFSAWYA